jgi:hypothetical protein
MNSIREIAKNLIASVEQTELDCLPDAGKRFKRIAIIDYAQALQRSPCRSVEENERYLGEAHLYAQRAVSCGVSEDDIDESFSRLRSFWLPKLKEKTCPEK